MTTDQAQNAKTHNLVTVVVLAAVGLAVFAQLTVWIPQLPALSATYGRTSATASGSVFAAAMALGVLVAGPLADRHGRRLLLLVGLVALAAASVAAAASPTWPLHLASRAAQGLAAASIPAAAIAWVSEALPTRRRALGLALLITAFQAATPVGQLYSQAVAALGGWRAVHASLAALYVLATIVLRRRLTPTQVGDGDPSAGTCRGLMRMLGRPALLACLALSGLLPGALVAMYTGLQRHLPDVASAPSDVVAAARLAGLVGILAGPFVLAGVRRWPLWSQAVAGASLCTAGLLAQTRFDSTSGLVALSALTAMSLPVAMVPLAAMVGDLVPNARASAIAIQSVLIFLGTAIGPVVAIRLGYATLCVAVAAAVAVAALAVAVVLPAGASRIWRAWRRGGWVATRPGWQRAAALGVVLLGVALLALVIPRDCGPACHGSAGVATAQADLDAPPHDRPPGGRRDAVGAGGTAGASTPPTTHRPATPAAQIPVGTRRDATTSRSSAEGSIVSTTRPVASPGRSVTLASTRPSPSTTTTTAPPTSSSVPSTTTVPSPTSTSTSIPSTSIPSTTTSTSMPSATSAPPTTTTRILEHH